ncbi:helix-turn-helix domain-containing protein [Actinoplanes sp. NPDC051346]|uniref:AAA family ATPase n=1 Tax=Actinoplanes sp. NPDC051346 TaxID=3155048 RepID=UPI00342C58EB
MRPSAHPATSAGTAGLSFPDLLRHHRLRSGLTQRALSDLSTVSPRTIRDLEAGRANARALTLLLLANGLRLEGTVREAFLQAGHHRRSTARLEVVAETRPASVDAVLGRDDEIRAIAELLTSGRRRMVSLSGLPGVGKTRVAAEVAAWMNGRHRWPVLWEDAGPRTFGRHDTARIRQIVGSQAALLVLDGIANGDDCTPAVAGLLGACPELRVITTSHQPWQLAGIQTTVLAPLPTPEPSNDLAEITALPSVRLLVDRLSEVRTGFTLTADDAAATAELCRRLDGLPLALEAVACRGRVLGVRQLAQMSVWDLLGLTVPARTEQQAAARHGTDGPRSQTIGGLLRACCDALTAEQESLLHALATDDRSWTVAQVVTSLGQPWERVIDVLDVLIGRGLVRATPGNTGTELRVPQLVRALLHPAGRDDVH